MPVPPPTFQLDKFLFSIFADFLISSLEGKARVYEHGIGDAIDGNQGGAGGDEGAIRL